MPTTVQTKAVAIARDRERRAATFGELDHLFRQPAWDVLIDLLAHDGLGDVYLTDACIASHAPFTTGLRTVQRLANAGLVDCVGDPEDHRRTIVRLTALGRETLTDYLEPRS